jgi:hypothetical protein
MKHRSVSTATGAVPFGLSGAGITPAPPPLEGRRRPCAPASSGEPRENGSLTTFSLRVFAPPYHAVVPLVNRGGAEELPFGSVIIAGDDAVVLALAGLTLACRQWPWAVPCLLAPPTSLRLEAPVRVVSELRDRLVMGSMPAGTTTLSPSTVVAAVRRRPCPSAASLARWVASRLRRDDLESALLAQFREALDGIPASMTASVSTFSRYFARLGPLTAHDWRALARLCTHASCFERDSRREHISLTMRAAVEHAVKYLGMAYHEMVARTGWEWVLERALRRAEYL